MNINKYLNIDTKNCLITYGENEEGAKAQGNEAENIQRFNNLKDMKEFLLKWGSSIREKEKERLAEEEKLREEERKRAEKEQKELENQRAM